MYLGKGLLVLSGPYFILTRIFFFASLLRSQDSTSDQILNEIEVYDLSERKAFQTGGYVCNADDYFPVLCRPCYIGTFQSDSRKTCNKCLPGKAITAIRTFEFKTIKTRLREILPKSFSVLA
jgi:hypothetical protein